MSTVSETETADNQIGGRAPALAPGTGSAGAAVIVVAEVFLAGGHLAGGDSLEGCERTALVGTIHTWIIGDWASRVQRRRAVPARHR